LICFIVTLQNKTGLSCKKCLSFALTFLRAGVHLSGHGAAAGDGDDEVESAMMQVCGPILGVDAVDLDVPLIDLGLASIQALRLKERLEQQFPQAEIGIGDLLDGVTLREIIVLVKHGRGTEQDKRLKDMPADKAAEMAGKPPCDVKERTPGWSWDRVDPDKRRGLEHHYVQVASSIFSLSSCNGEQH
jgi:hypothetical protein